LVHHTKEVYKNWLGEPELSLVTGNLLSELGDVYPLKTLLDILEEEVRTHLQNGGRCVMSTLLLRLAAPMQGWGVDTFERRGTERIPTKSGVVGLLASALGRRRNESIDDLTKLRFGVRVDREGTLLRDFHTARSQKSAYVTIRYYLSDAVFLVGLEGNKAFLYEIEYALRHPVFPLYLGRRSCPPEGKLSLGVREDKTLLQALKEEPWLVSDYIKMKEDTEVRLR
jgi:CRISPR system Cascade subunit CasD